MPISRDEYDIGEIEVSLYVFQFLRENSDYAFSLDELANVVVQSAQDPGREELMNILEGLAQSKKVERRDIRGVVYYRYYKRPLGFRLE